MQKYPSNTEPKELPPENNQKTHNRLSCAECDKVMFHSKHEARRALVGQLASKSVRVYECPSHPGMWHLTKVWKKKRVVKKK